MGTKASTTLARTPEEILKRIELVEERDPLGWTRPVLIASLPYEHAKPWLKEGVTKGDWEQEIDPKRAAIDYIDFAWEKALGERGISSNRSVDKLREWVWLSGDDALLVEFEGAPYPMYGRPKLVVLTEAWAPDKLPAVEAFDG